MIEYLLIAYLNNPLAIAEIKKQHEAAEKEAQNNGKIFFEFSAPPEIISIRTELFQTEKSCQKAKKLLRDECWNNGYSIDCIPLKIGEGR